MRTIISATDNKVTAAFDKRFGRGAWFCLYDDETGNVEFIKNEHENASNGAGTKAAETVVAKNVKKVVSGDFGPKAKELLEKFDVQMVILQDDNITIEDIINKLKN